MSPTGLPSSSLLQCSWAVKLVERGASNGTQHLAYFVESPAAVVVGIDGDWHKALDVNRVAEVHAVLCDLVRIEHARFVLLVGLEQGHGIPQILFDLGVDSGDADCVLDREADDDDASKALLSELLQSSPVPVFNPLRADPLSVNQVPYPAAAPASAGVIKVAAPPASSTLLDRLASDEVQDAPLRRGVRSSKESSRINTRSVLRSATSGKPLTSPHPAVTTKSLAVN